MGWVGVVSAGIVTGLCLAGGWWYIKAQLGKQRDAFGFVVNDQGEDEEWHAFVRKNHLHDASLIKKRQTAMASLHPLTNVISSFTIDDRVFHIDVVPWKDDRGKILGVHNLWIQFARGVRLQLDTGSMDLVVDLSKKTSSTNNMVARTVVDTSDCMVEHYAGGVVQTCSATIYSSDDKDKKGLRVRLLQPSANNKATSSNTLLPSDILGLCPGHPFDTHTLVRQWDVSKISINLFNETIVFNALYIKHWLAEYSNKSQSKTFAVHPQIFDNWTVVPLITIWHWSDHSSTLWVQEMIEQQIQTRQFVSDKNHQTTNTSTKPLNILLCLDTGTSDGILTNPYNVSVETQQHNNNPLVRCTGVTFACASKMAFRVRDVYNSTGACQRFVDECLNNEQSPSSILNNICDDKTHHLSCHRFALREHLSSIPQLTSNVPGRSQTLELVLGMHALANVQGEKQTVGFEMTLDKTTKAPSSWTFFVY